ncbi:hypothetical protein VPHD249_0087 [Vibrio phage D249]
MGACVYRATKDFSKSYTKLICNRVVFYFLKELFSVTIISTFSSLSK